MSELHLGDDTVLTVRAMNGQYRIEANSEQYEDWPIPINALTTGEAGWIAVLTGTHNGPVAIRFQFLTAAPALVETGWDMVGERDLYCEEDTVKIKDLFTSMPPHIIIVVPGTYRLRLHVAGRSAAASVRMLSEPIERHFIQMWAVSQATGQAILAGPDDWGTAFMEQVTALQNRTD